MIYNVLTKTKLASRNEDQFRPQKQVTLGGIMKRWLISYSSPAINPLQGKVLAWASAKQLHKCFTPRSILASWHQKITTHCQICQLGHKSHTTQGFVLNSDTLNNKSSFVRYISQRMNKVTTPGLLWLPTYLRTYLSFSKQYKSFG